MQESHLVKSKKAKSAEEARNEQNLIQERVQMENEIKMLNIACESKDRLIDELNLKVLFLIFDEQIKNAEIAQLKNTELLMARKEKLDQLEQLNRNRAHELIQIGQDKSMIQDELADAKNHQDRNEKKLKALQAQNKALEIKLEETLKESEKWKEFAQAMDQVDATMKGLRSQLQSGLLKSA